MHTRIWLSKHKLKFSSFRVISTTLIN